MIPAEVVLAESSTTPSMMSLTLTARITVNSALRSMVMSNPATVARWGRQKASMRFSVASTVFLVGAGTR